MNDFVPKRHDFIEELYKPLSDELFELRRLNEEEGIPLILRETEDMLSVLLDIHKPHSILEVGTAYGYSSVFFAIKCPDARITTIEKSDKMLENAKITFEKYGLSDRIEILEGDAEEMLKSLSKSSKYDFVFIDAAKTHYREYFDLAFDHLNSGAVIVCDDVLIKGWIYDRSLPGSKRHRTSVKYMKSFLEYIKSREDLSVAVTGSADGLAIIKLND